MARLVSALTLRTPVPVCDKPGCMVCRARTLRFLALELAKEDQSGAGGTSAARYDMNFASAQIALTQGLDMKDFLSEAAAGYEFAKSTEKLEKDAMEAVAEDVLSQAEFESRRHNKH